MRERGGQGSVETLFVVAIIALLFFGAVELGRGVLLKHSLDVGTAKAARMLSIRPTDYALAVAVARAEVDGNLVGGGRGDDVSMSLYDAATVTTITTGQLAAAGYGYRFLVASEIAFLADVPFLSLSGRTITAVHQGIVEAY